MKTKNHTQKTIGCLLVIFITGFWLWFLSMIVADYFLPKMGNCKTAVLTADIIHFKRGKPALTYELRLGDEIYEGNSTVEDLNRVGDSVCIVYFEKMPFFRRPVTFFDQSDCSCK